MKKLCYFINSDWYFDLHWIDRAIAARDAGYEIHIISHFVDGKVLNKFKTFVLSVITSHLMLNHLMH
ncbi:glycosyl transferase [Klebsiella grimontii]|uniref:Glycosyl transferase n=1 Tax=Klebsiella grimontii TaxID=2058152 RepID=A0A7H4P0I2_9ENTR|nr:glycosyl transferase [Klebsiella grimontii]